jgi:Uma2 family endonuclease
VIIEVLSDSTEKYDRTDNFAAYRQIPTLQEYVMIDQSRVYVECFHKTKSKLWTLETYRELDSILKLQSLEIEIQVGALYDRVEWEAA